MFKCLLIVTLVTVTSIIPQCEGNCIWYGICYPVDPDDIEEGTKALNCPYVGPGKKLEDKDAQATMLRLCPELFTNCKQESHVMILVRGNKFVIVLFLASEPLCCDANMIKMMEFGMNMAAGVYGRCDTCQKNLHKSICALNCSPKQSEFLVGKNGTKVDDGKNGESTFLAFFFRNSALKF